MRFDFASSIQVQTTSTHANSVPRFYVLLDLLRAFAAISVIIYHVIEHFEWKTFPIDGPLVWFRVGWMGVDLFFVISGFVITMSALGLLDRLEASGFRRSFAWRRLLRIAPLHYVTCVIFLIAIRSDLLFQSGVVTNVLAHALFVHNLSSDWAGAINGPNWSVAVEMQFYLLMFIFAPKLLRVRAWKVIASLVLIAWMWRAFAVCVTPLNSPLGTYELFWLSTQLPGTLDQFACGILLAILVRAGALEWLRTKLGELGAVMAVVGATIVVLYIMSSVFWLHAEYWDSLYMVVFWRTLESCAFALVVASACIIKVPRIASLILAPLLYLGTISYGLYLWHLFVIESLKGIPGLQAADALPLVLLLTFLLAAGSWHLFEKAFIAAGHRRTLTQSST